MMNYDVLWLTVMTLAREPNQFFLLHRSLSLKSGVWDVESKSAVESLLRSLESGVWRLESGIWSLESEVWAWSLESGIWSQKVIKKNIVFYGKNVRAPRFCMRVVNLGVRNHCVLQQIRADARLQHAQGITSRVAKTCRQEPYSLRTVWVINYDYQWLTAINYDSIYYEMINNDYYD